MIAILASWKKWQKKNLGAYHIEENKVLQFLKKWTYILHNKIILLKI